MSNTDNSSNGMPEVKSTGGSIKTRIDAFAEAWVAQENKALKEEFVGYLARSVILEEMGPPRRVRNTVVVVLGFLALFIAIATFTKVDEKAPTTGMIMPQGFIQRVEHQEGGRIARIVVADGDHVAAGDPLVIMDSTAPVAEYEAMAARDASLGLKAERMRALATGNRPDFTPFAAKYPVMAADEDKIYQSDLAHAEAQRLVAQSDVRQMEARVTGLQEQKQGVEDQLSALQEQLRMRKELLASGLTSKVVYLETERAVAKTRTELSAIKTEIAESASTLSRANEQLSVLVSKQHADAFDEMGRSLSEKSQSQEYLMKLEDRVMRTTVRSPVAGVVQGLAVHAAGEVVESGGYILDVVPDDKELIAKVRVHPRDIGYVKAGDKAVAKIETFNYARYGGIPGKVRTVSASSFTDPRNGEIYFEALVQLERGYVGSNPDELRIAPGMTLVADIETGRKSLIGYLMKPVSFALSRAFSER